MPLLWSGSHFWRRWWRQTSEPRGRGQYPPEHRACHITILSMSYCVKLWYYWWNDFINLFLLWSPSTRFSCWSLCPLSWHSTSLSRSPSGHQRIWQLGAIATKPPYGSRPFFRDNYDAAEPATQDDSLPTQPQAQPPTVANTVKHYTVSLLCGMSIANRHTIFMFYNITF